MGIELVTGKVGRLHASSGQIGLMHAGIFGRDTYLMDTGNMIAASMTTANTCHIKGGDVMMQGRHVHFEETDVTIDNGTQSQSRNDLICIDYTVDGNGIEATSLVVVKGAPGTAAADPSYAAGSIFNGASHVQTPIYRISLSGLTAAVPVLLIPTAASLKTLQDSVSQTLLWSGSSGKTGTYTLGKSASGFSGLKILYTDDNGLNRVAEVQPSGAWAFSFSTIVLTTGDCWHKYVQGTVSGTALTITGQRVVNNAVSGLADAQVATIKAVYGVL